MAVEYRGEPFDADKNRRIAGNPAGQVRQVAAARPYMDLSRVGIYGHSWGGYFALRGILTAPDVFTVAVASAPGELTEAQEVNEPYMDLPQNNKEGYAAGLNAACAPTGCRCSGAGSPCPLRAALNSAAFWKRAEA